MADIYLLIESKQEGPYTEEQIRQYLAEGRIQGDLLAWREGLAEWVALSGVVNETNAFAQAALRNPTETSSVLPEVSAEREEAPPTNNALLKGVEMREEDVITNRNASSGKSRLKKFKGIGLLEVNSIANNLLTLLKVFAVIFCGIGLLMDVPCALIARSHGDFPPQVVILGAVGIFLFFGAGLAYIGLAWLVKKRLFRSGNWYILLQRSANVENSDTAKEAANALLALTGTDLLTSKLKARAHLYFAYYQTADLGAGHWSSLLTLLNLILNQEPDNEEFRLDRAQAYQHIKKYHEALQDLEVLTSDKEHPNLRAYSLKISCLTVMNQLDEAKLACENLKALTPRFPNSSAVANALLAHKAEIDAKNQRGTVS